MLKHGAPLAACDAGHEVWSLTRDVSCRRYGELAGQVVTQ